MFPIGARDGDGRLPPGQRLTEKFPVMTAGSPRVTPAAEWDFELLLEDEEGERRPLGRWDYAASRALGLVERTHDIHCVTRWSKLDTRWRGVDIGALLGHVGFTPDFDAPPVSFPVVYARAECDGDYSANLKLRDLVGGQAMIALDYAGAALELAHGGPARLLAPKLYFWKSAKWIRRLVLSPYDRKGFWETLGYHNHGDPWREQRYRGLSETDHRTTLDNELSREIRRQRLRGKRPGGR